MEKFAISKSSEVFHPQMEKMVANILRSGVCTKLLHFTAYPAATEPWLTSKSLQASFHAVNLAV